VMDLIPKNSKGLAPMEGVTDFPTRQWFRLIGGMDFLWTPFLRVTDTFPSQLPRTFIPEIFELKGQVDPPTVLQLMGSRPEDIVRTFDLLGEISGGVDLNCGCPSPTVVGSRAGSSLLEKADYFLSFIEAVIRGIGPGRLSVKMRTGFHSEAEFLDLYSALQSLPLKHLTVHGRTRAQKYTGVANWDLIERAAASCPFPVIGSGDISDDDGLAQRLGAPQGVHAVIIGRGALRNPWVFKSRREAPVVAALVLYVVMQDLFITRPQEFVHWSAEIPFEELETAEDFKRVTSHYLRAAGISVSATKELSCSPRALSRGKMLWNYMRSSLPESFMDPRILRVQRLSDLILATNEISRQLGINPDNLPLRYQAKHDWIYSGQAKVRSLPNGPNARKD
jgi:tRNA-dihydrouridine synthase